MKTYVHTKAHMWMFTLVSSVTKNWEQPKCPLARKWRSKLWYTHTMEYYSATKRNKLPICTAAEMNLKCKMIHERSQAHKAAYSDSIYVTSLNGTTTASESWSVSPGAEGNFGERWNCSKTCLKWSLHNVCLLKLTDCTPKRVKFTVYKLYPNLKHEKQILANKHCLQIW